MVVVCYDHTYLFSFNTKPQPMYRKLLLSLYLTLGAALFAVAQSPQANIDQGNNGKNPNAINDPVVWVNGNLNESQNHYIEGQSIAYRAVLDRI